MKRQLNRYGISYWKIWIRCLCIGVWYYDFIFSLLSSLLIPCGINHSETGLYLSNFKLLISFLNCQLCFPFRISSENKGMLIFNSEVLRYCFSGIQVYPLCGQLRWVLPGQKVACMCILSIALGKIHGNAVLGTVCSVLSWEWLYCIAKYLCYWMYLPIPSVCESCCSLLTSFRMLNLQPLYVWRQLILSHPSSGPVSSRILSASGGLPR